MSLTPGASSYGPPPPPRSAPITADDQVLELRTTSAFAESSRTTRSASTWTTDHLRLRGELEQAGGRWRLLYGPPPPSRRVPLGRGQRSSRLRTTSAFAESSRCGGSATPAASDHLCLRGELGLSLGLGLGNAGPPPPSRRARVPRRAPDLAGRTTSAFAESSTPPSRPYAAPPDHLLLCGELVALAYRPSVEIGPPPPSRRAHDRADSARHEPRTTSTFAESSPARRAGTRTRPDHLRLRGELLPDDLADHLGYGPPPPSRRAPSSRLTPRVTARTTSAFAESSARCSTMGHGLPDHLRLRGELDSGKSRKDALAGPPPPSRRARPMRLVAIVYVRTTSAFAESSSSRTARRRHAADHLRLRGELQQPRSRARSGTGPPPPSPSPSRRARPRRRGRPEAHRTTSAFAESSNAVWKSPALSADHLRLRGELRWVQSYSTKAIGPPPPSRRARVPQMTEQIHDRTTSAFAESSRATDDRADP